MYSSFFGFSEKPFEVTPDPKYLYSSPSHQETLASLVYGIKERRGFICLTGEVGTGKTMLIHAALDRLDEYTKVGLPTDADLVIDVRFLPNPYFVNALKKHDGLEKPVREYILAREEAREFLERFRSFLGYLIPLYWKEGKSYLTIAIGCTGGMHRSVAIVEEIADGFQSDMVSIRKRHRDIGKS